MAKIFRKTHNPHVLCAVTHSLTLSKTYEVGNPLCDTTEIMVKIIISFSGRMSLTVSDDTDRMCMVYPQRHCFVLGN